MYNSLDMGLSFNPEETYTAMLDCAQAAADGRCLMSYANTARSIYHRYGFIASMNADIAYGLGSLVPKLKATKNIAMNTEILWPYGRTIRMPSTFEEEKYARIGGNESINEGPYDFTREEVIDRLTNFAFKHTEAYITASNLVEGSIDDASGTIRFNHVNVDIKAEHFARCRPYPVKDNDDKKGGKKKAKKKGHADEKIVVKKYR